MGSQILTTGIPKARSGLRSWISTGDALISWTFKISSIKRELTTLLSTVEAGYRATEGKHPSIRQVFVFTWRTCASFRGLNAQKQFFSLVKTASEIILSIQCETWFFNRRCHFNFLRLLGLTATAIPWRLKFKIRRNNDKLTSNIFQVYIARHSYFNVLYQFAANVN